MSEPASTPARRADGSPQASTDTPGGLPGPRDTAAHVAGEPLEQGRDIGWVLVVVGAVGALLLGWTLFSNDESNGMWAGYWNTLFCTIALLGASWLRSTLPTAPGVAITALCGLGMILTGALHDYDTTITVIMVGGGILIGIGAATQAKG